MEDAKNIAKNYDPKAFEDSHYNRWVTKGYFHAEIDAKRRESCRQNARDDEGDREDKHMIQKIIGAFSKGDDVGGDPF